MLILRGRVVDAEGRPAAGAEVWLGHNGTWLPGSRWPPADLSRTTDAAGEYVFDLTSEPQFAELHWPGALRAFLGRQVSQEIRVVWHEERIAAPDLVLEPGATGHVKVRWNDGSPGAGVHLLVVLEGRYAPRDDAREDTHAVAGDADEKGDLRFGPAPDRKYARVSVHATHPAAPRQSQCFENCRLDSPLGVVLTRGRVVSATLRTADGQPATGYRVAAVCTGDPEWDGFVEADELGRFEVAGVSPGRGRIACYDRAPTAEEIARLDDADRIACIGPPLSPLLIRDVQEGQDDLGTVMLPDVGTWTLHIEDSQGGRPRSGHVHWSRSNGHRHGSRGYRVDAHGIVRLHRMPMGIRAGLTVSIEDSRHGGIEQEFDIRKVKAKPVTLRVTGAGTVVLRLHPKGAPDRLLTVTHARVGERECCGRPYDGPLSELRWWTRPGFYPFLNVAAEGFRGRRLENVEVRGDGPTFLDVELEPR